MHRKTSFLQLVLIGTDEIIQRCAEICFFKIIILEKCFRQIAAIENRFAEIITGEMRFLHARIAENRLLHFLLLEGGIIEHTICKAYAEQEIIRGRKIHAGDLAAGEPDIFQAGSFQLDQTKIAVIKSAVEKIGAGEIGS